MSLERGAICGEKYRLETLLGSGGVGVVWSANHLLTGKRVALKFLRPEAADDLDARRRFIREARAVCTVQHPNVIQVHDVLEPDGGPPIIVMELLHGETLGARLRREQKLAPATMAMVMMPVLDAVAAGHAKGILHRDLKPDNIFLCAGQGAPAGIRVLDFGLAKLTAIEGAAASSAALTGTGSMLGTPYYMSPEQVFGEKDIDARADIWSLGIVMYECLTGVRPTESSNVGQIFKRITTGSIESIQTRQQELPSDLAELVMRMLSVDRAKRPATIDEVRAVVARYLCEADSFAPTAAALPKRAAQTGQPTLMSSALSQARSAKPRSRRLPLVVPLIGLAVLGAGLLLATRTKVAGDASVSAPTVSSRAMPVPSPVAAALGPASAVVPSSSPAPEAPPPIASVPIAPLVPASSRNKMKSRSLPAPSAETPRPNMSATAPAASSPQPPRDLFNDPN